MSIIGLVFAVLALMVLVCGDVSELMDRVPLIGAEFGYFLVGLSIAFSLAGAP